MDMTADSGQTICKCLRCGKRFNYNERFVMELGIGGGRSPCCRERYRIIKFANHADESYVNYVGFTH